MSHNRNTKYLDNKRIVYRRDPISDKPTQENECYLFYEEGTYECYSLFSSKAKITTYKSLKWHLLVMWYLNPQLDQDQFMEIAEVIAYKEQGFTTFTIHPELLGQLAKLMTQLNYHQELEEYEACAEIKKEIDIVNDKLSKI